MAPTPTQMWHTRDRYGQCKGISTMTNDLTSTIFYWFCEQLEQLVHPNCSPHLLPVIVNRRSTNRPPSNRMHLFWACAIWKKTKTSTGEFRSVVESCLKRYSNKIPTRIHSSLFCSLVHCFHFGVWHGWAAGHKVDSFKYTNSTSLETLELNGFSIFAWKNEFKEVETGLILLQRNTLQGLIMVLPVVGSFLTSTI